MSSLSSRFSSFSSSSANNAKSFNPPKPTYNSPKLVRDARLAPSTRVEVLPKVAHPFASASYTASRHSTVEPDCSNRQPGERSRSGSTGSIHAFGPHTSEFGPILEGLDDTCSPHTRANLSGSPESGSLPIETMGRTRSSTLGSHDPQPSEFGALPTLLPSPNPFKSRFDDDSEDEEKLDSAAKALVGVPHRARLAAIGTASRLFKGKRHSRNSSATLTPSPTVRDLPPHLQLDKRSTKQRDKEIGRPSASDGMSPLPRQAVFGHRPSPSELSFNPKSSDKTRRLEPADRDLILGLTGAAPTPRLKLPEKKKSLPKTPGEHAISHQRQASASVIPPISNVRVSWIDPPPYCFSDQAQLYRSDSLRKSQSLSTLRFDPTRRPRQPSNPPEAPAHNAASAAQAERSAWEAMLSTSPSTASDRSSLSSCGRVTRVETIPDSPPRPSLHKAQRLPPQKPPPQSLPPPPPPLPPKRSLPPAAESSQSSVKSSLEVDTPSLTSTGSSASSEKHAESPKHSIESVRSQSKPASLQTPRQLISGDTQRIQPGGKVVLDVGGTKFVTLVSTLHGAPGDEPLLIQDLSPHGEMQAKGSPEAALCTETQLTRRKRVDRTTRHEREDSQNSNSDSPTCVFTTVLAEASQTKPSDLDSSVASLQQRSAQTSNGSSGSLATLSSRLDSETSTRRTSDLSDASAGWSHDVATNASPAQIFLDRNPTLYPDILDILRTRNLPYRLQAASVMVVPSSHGSSTSCQNGADCALAALKLQLRCRLYQLKEEAEWLGYRSIVDLCEKEVFLL